jgi:hypothetical protein
MKPERKFQVWAKRAERLLRKYEVCATLLFDLKHGWRYNVCIELVGKIGEEEGIFQQIPFLFFRFCLRICGAPVSAGGAEKKRRNKHEFQAHDFDAAGSVSGSEHGHSRCFCSERR